MRPKGGCLKTRNLFNQKRPAWRLDAPPLKERQSPPQSTRALTPQSTYALTPESTTLWDRESLGNHLGSQVSRRPHCLFRLPESSTSCKAANGLGAASPGPKAKIQAKVTVCAIRQIQALGEVRLGRQNQVKGKWSCAWPMYRATPPKGSIKLDVGKPAAGAAKGGWLRGQDKGTGCKHSCAAGQLQAYDGSWWRPMVDRSQAYDGPWWRPICWAWWAHGFHVWGRNDLVWETANLNGIAATRCCYEDAETGQSSAIRGGSDADGLKGPLSATS